MKPEVTWRGHDGSVWQLAGARHGQGGVHLTDVDGLVSRYNRSLAPQSNGVGARVKNTIVDTMTGTLKLDIFADGDTPLSEVYSRFRKSWSATRPGTLTVQQPNSPRWTLEVVADQVPAPPSSSQWAAGIRRLSMDVSVLGLSGVWRYVPLRASGAEVPVHNAGNLPVCPSVVWQGSGKAVTLPSGVRIELPTVQALRWLSTDPGRGFVITDADDVPDKAAWSAMRGRAAPGRVEPGASAKFRLEGCELEYELLTDDPWA